MKIRLTLGLISLAATISILFQNCGNYTGTSEQSVSSELEVADDAKFKAGDDFNAKKIPYTLDPDFKNLVENYRTRVGFKALALAANGKGSIRSGDAFYDQEDANQAALQDCQLIAQLPCALFAEGDFIKYDERDFYSHHGFWITDVVNFDPNALPGLAKQWRESNTYINRTNAFKAYAIGPSGAGSAGWSEDSQAEANRRALEFCEILSTKLHPCVLYAVGNNVVFKSSSFSWSSPQISQLAGDPLVIAKIPFIREVDRNPILNLYNQISSSKHLVVVMSRYGHYRAILASSIAAAKETALNNCNAALDVDSRYECFVYSEDKNVVMSIQSLRAASFK